MGRPFNVLDLPPPLHGKSGWPWTLESRAIATARADGAPWPRISIVTPSYNQGRFIEETIRSVLLQGYPNLEYIIIDGGSTDDSVEIIRKYDAWLTHWVSEKDRGQSNAINKGLRRATGEIFQWINSDDVVLPEALLNVGRAYRGDAVASAIMEGNTIDCAKVVSNRDLSPFGTGIFRQPGLWLPRKKVVQIGIDETLNFAFDWDLLLRCLVSWPQVTYISVATVFFRLHSQSKTVSQARQWGSEAHRIRARLHQAINDPELKQAWRKSLRRHNWHRHVDKWRYAPSATGAWRDAQRMLSLALREPQERIDRHWFGAFRRVLWTAAKSSFAEKG